MKNEMEYKWSYVEDSSQYSLLCALHLIGGKWKMPIIWVLRNNGTMRYNELKRKLSLAGINNTMLAHCLRELEENDLISRVSYCEIPPKVEYSLTSTGNELMDSLNPLVQWSNKLLDDRSLTDSSLSCRG